MFCRRFFAPDCLFWATLLMLASTATAADTAPAPIKVTASTAAVDTSPLEQLLSPARQQRAKYVTKLDFNPEQCKYFDRIQEQIRPSLAQRKAFASQGFVSLNDSAGTFGEAYHRIYAYDLPVFVTSDSILNVLHNSFDNSLLEIEQDGLSPILAEILAKCATALRDRAKTVDAEFAENYRDVDLYLTVARRLLNRLSTEAATTSSAMNQDEAVDKILRDIESLTMQRGLVGPKTMIFGSQRPIDYSQFKPRGHYDKTLVLRRYFQAMMWLSRADTGWNVLPTDPRTGINNNAERELRDAVLLCELLAESRQMDHMAALDATLELLVGGSDNLRPAELLTIMKESGVATLADLKNDAPRRKLLAKVAAIPSTQQKICSQVVFGSKQPGESIPLPGLFQMLGQRFAIDSLVLNSVVYDAVPPVQMRRRDMPCGADVFAAFGNHQATYQLRDELTRYQYAPQLLSAQKVAAQYFAEISSKPKTLYDLWLTALLSLHADLSAEANFPQAMRTEAWQLKQLQTQLASWAELRHDAGILYVKQSYTREEECDYPAGFVEPYPEFYVQVRHFAERTAAALSSVSVLDSRLQFAMEHPRRFWSSVGATMDKLELLARKELKGQAFSVDEANFLKRTVKIVEEGPRGKCGARQSPAQGQFRFANQTEPASLHLVNRGRNRSYSGWYCDLAYPHGDMIEQFLPCVADVHSDPNGQQVLEVGSGDAHFAIIAIDNGAERMAFVGPIFSYYEFTQPASDRMTDVEFRRRLESGPVPTRPNWIYSFQP